MRVLDSAGQYHRLGETRALVSDFRLELRPRWVMSSAAVRRVIELASELSDDERRIVVDAIAPDEEFPEKDTACDTTVEGCPGFTAPGKQACIQGELACEANHCDTTDANATGCFCTVAGAAVGGQGKPCGVPGATQCIPGVDKCIPNAVCAGASGDEECRLVEECINFPDYWKPEDLNIDAATCL